MSGHRDEKKPGHEAQIKALLAATLRMRRGQRGGDDTGVVLLFVLLLLGVLASVVVARSGEAPLADLVAEEELGAEVWSSAPEPGDGGGAVAAKMPTTPLKGQATPPCKPYPVNVELNGACWYRIDGDDPSCPGTWAAVDPVLKVARCYLPAPKARRPPTSVQP